MIYITHDFKRHQLRASFSLECFPIPPCPIKTLSETSSYSKCGGSISVDIAETNTVGTKRLYKTV